LDAAFQILTPFFQLHAGGRIQVGPTKQLIDLSRQTLELASFRRTAAPFSSAGASQLTPKTAQEEKHNLVSFQIGDDRQPVNFYWRACCTGGQAKMSLRDFVKLAQRRES
jgi:hypothetical protein